MTKRKAKLNSFEPTTVLESTGFAYSSESGAAINAAYRIHMAI
jgi:hypothetical protein